MSKGVKILAIESSCDETAAAVVEDGVKVLSNIIYSQIDVHTLYGGVVPEIASRAHMDKINPVVKAALDEAGVTPSELSAVAVTYGPGLVGSLLVGTSFAKAYAYACGLPVIGVNHISGHICANYIEHPELKPPYGCLVVSGGHTHLVKVADHGEYEIIGRTMDDAAGEAFDKVARVMGLPYPGGPQIDKLAKEGDPLAIDFPQALQEKGNYEFSFSGLKSAVLNYLHNCEQKKLEVNKADVAASFQRAVIEVLVFKAMDALKEAGLETLVLAGGVAANSALEARLKEELEKNGKKFYYPDKILCTDNAAMIGCRGYYQALEGRFSDFYLNAVPGLELFAK